MNKNKFKNWLSEKWILWNSDIETYQDKVSNFHLSPKQLFDSIWLNKDSELPDVEHLEGTQSKGKIKNSPANRKPNYKNEGKRVDKISYLMAAIAYIRDYNQLPISMIINKKGEKEFDYLLAKDRGTFNYYATKRFEKQSVRIWEKVLARLREFEHKNRMREIITRIESLIEKNKSFNVIEAIPEKLLNEWFDDSEMISLRMKFETFKDHSNEMSRYNNSENVWVDHNHIMSNNIVPKTVSNPTKYPISILDDVYETACKYDLFAGKHKICARNIPHKTTDEYEGFFPWMFHSLFSTKTLDTTKKIDADGIVNVIARKTDGNLEKKKIAYKKAFDSPTFKSEIEEVMKNLDIIANSEYLSDFNQSYNERMGDLEPDEKKRRKKKNWVDLSLEQWDTFFVVSMCILKIFKEIYEGRVGNQRLQKVISIFFEEATLLLSDDDTMFPLGSEIGGLSNRWKGFWEKALDNASERLESELNGDFNSGNLYNLQMKALKDASIFGNSMYFYDRVSSTQFEKVIVDKSAFEDGHIEPTGGVKYGNIVLQPKKDNNYNSNKPINDIEHYTAEYLSNLDVYLDGVSDKDYMARERTKEILNSWKQQKEYKV